MSLLDAQNAERLENKDLTIDNITLIKSHRTLSSMTFLIYRFKSEVFYIKKTK